MSQDLMTEGTPCNLSSVASSRRCEHFFLESNAVITFVSPPTEMGLVVFKIRTDVYRDPATNICTAIMEMPGVKKDEVKIVLTTDKYSGARELNVTGDRRLAYPSVNYMAREIKHGVFQRYVVVPLATKVNIVSCCSSP